MQITQPRWGIFGQRYGSFAGKTSTDTDVSVGILTIKTAITNVITLKTLVTNNLELDV